MMETRRIATYLARTRVGLGLALVLAPRLILFLMLGRIARASLVGPLGRIAGARDAALGAGAAISIGQRRGGGDWVSMGAVVDMADGVVLMVTPGLARRARLVGASALGLGVYQLVLARELAAAERAEA
jgi:hypothetical protein